jgi:hypothetical protein
LEERAMNPHVFDMNTDPQRGYYDDLNGTIDQPIIHSTRKQYKYYPSYEDLPPDIVSVDEIFQQTKIVGRRRRRQYIIHDSIEKSIGDDNLYQHYQQVEQRQTFPLKPQNMVDDETFPPYRYNAARSSDVIDSNVRIYGDPSHSMEQSFTNSDNYDTDSFDYKHRDYIQNQCQTENDTMFENVVTTRLIPSMRHQLSCTDSEARLLYHSTVQSEVVPVSIPDMDETSIYSSSHNDVIDDSDLTNPKFKVAQIEIAPGKYLPLRGAAETTHAMECGFCVTIPCMVCNTLLICIANCELVLCPDCRILSPNTIMTLKNSNRSINTAVTMDNEISVRLDVKCGVGLGLQV